MGWKLLLLYLLILMGGIKTVFMGLRPMNTTRDLTTEQRSEMTKVINYLENNKDRMDYQRYLAAGLPIATGFSEGACRQVVTDHGSPRTEWQALDSRRSTSDAESTLH